MKTRIIELDILRAVAICYIIMVRHIDDYASEIFQCPRVTSIIVNISYSSFCMYLFHRIIFNIMLDVYRPETDILILIYLYIIAVPIVIFASYFIQTRYDSLLNFRLSYKSYIGNS